jgi:transposase
VTTLNSASTTKLAAFANSRLATEIKKSCRTFVGLISTPMQREASTWKGHKRWPAARTTATSDSRGSRTELLSDLKSGLYRARNLVERFFNRIKQCRRVATRYDKLAANDLAFVKLAAIRMWLRAYESTPWSIRGAFVSGEARFRPR